MSTIHIKTLVEALDQPRLIGELVTITGYPIHRVLTFILEARAAGYHIFYRMGPTKGEPGTWELEP